MSKYSSGKIRENFSELLNQVAYGKERVVVTRRGKQVAALIPMDDLALLEKMENKTDIDDARKGIADAKKQGAVSWDSIKKERRHK
ncbi:MAG: prevent-host-death family protein [Deltaproteobacteria bacterium RIFCSPHIGHO2_12_FULL_43_9]|nr:MAG: prevent-host-death family protein [Deltaproteobacteria bacterium RIFCSPHIGHO2_12_FULL_43_9]